MPIISVIITAYNRKNFVGEAIRSVLDQTLPREEYEIIVAKNFNDSNIDQLIAAHSIISLLDQDCTIGKMMLDALKVSSGSIVAFLDDDDLFGKNKLQKLKDVFTSNTDVCYYRNGYNEIDENGNFIFSKRSKGSLLIVDSHYAIHMQSNKLRMNSSCISFRKKIVEGKLDLIENIVGAPDLALFYIAAAASCHFCLDPEPLTRYRIHSLSAIHSSSRNDYLREIQTLDALSGSFRNEEILGDIERTRLRLSILSAFKAGSLDRQQAFSFVKKYFALPPHKMADLFFFTVVVISIIHLRIGIKILTLLDARGPRYR